MSRGLGRLQRRILEALEPSQQICGRFEFPRQHTVCIPDLCYRWISGPPYVHAQFPPEVFDLVRVRRYLERQEAPTRPQMPLPTRASLHERAVWALAHVGTPNPRAFGADVARALRTLLERGELVRCDSIPLVRYARDPFHRPHPWVHVYGEERATLFWPYERRVRFVTRGEHPKR